MPGSSINTALRRLASQLERGVSNQTETTGENLLLNIGQFLAFRNRLLTFEAACPPDFSGITQRMTQLGAGVTHAVYALDAQDAGRLGTKHAILRVNRFEICEGVDPYRGRMLDSLVVEAWINVQMGQLGLGPQVPHACLQQRIASEGPHKNKLTLALVIERYPTSLSALLVNHPTTRLSEERLTQAIERASTITELVLVDSKLQNFLASPPVVGGGDTWQIVMTDFDPPLAAYVPELSASCRSLFTLAKVGLELVCGGKHSIGSAFVGRIEVLEREDPQCAQALFSPSKSWESVPPALRTLLGWYPCVLEDPNAGQGKFAEWQSCMLSAGGLNRNTLSASAARPGQAWTPANREAAFVAQADVRGAVSRYNDRLYRGRDCIYPGVDDTTAVRVPRPPPLPDFPLPAPSPPSPPDSSSPPSPIPPPPPPPLPCPPDPSSPPSPIPSPPPPPLPSPLSPPLVAVSPGPAAYVSALQRKAAELFINILNQKLTVILNQNLTVARISVILAWTIVLLIAFRTLATRRSHLSTQRPLRQGYRGVAPACQSACDRESEEIEYL